MKANPLDDFVNYVEKNHGEETWIPLYRSLNKDDKSEDGAFYTVLVSKGYGAREFTWSDLILDMV